MEEVSVAKQMKTGEDDGKASRNEGESSKIVEIDASTGEEILSEGRKWKTSTQIPRSKITKC